MTLLTQDSRDVMQRRIDMGVACLRCVDPTMALDNETAAKDAISSILTALFGPAGVYYDGEGVSYNGDAFSQGRALLDDALCSWEGDAEDYNALDEASSGIARIKKLYDDRAREYRESVEPGVSDNSWLEAQLEVLHDVIGILEDAEAEGGS